MNIVITQWGLNSYLNLKHKKVFDQAEFDTKIKPDVKLLKRYPNDPKFGNGKFWSQATDKNSHSILAGFKMKWHQVGNGRVQLRLPVAILNDAFLCEGYVKSNDKVDKRMMAKLKTHIQLIKQGRFISRGVIT